MMRITVTKRFDLPDEAVAEVLEEFGDWMVDKAGHDPRFEDQTPRDLASEFVKLRNSVVR
jgi:hypothetical protein